MAGIRQHYLPQFLLKGFASRINREEVYTRVFKKNKDPYETNIKNVGIEKYFYTRENTSSDNIITSVESNYSLLINNLRKLSYGIKLEPKAISEFIAHLIIRINHIRTTFKNLGRFLLNNVIKNIQNPSEFKRILLQYNKNNPEKFKSSLLKEFEKENRIFLNFELQNFLCEQIFKNIDSLLDIFVANIHPFILKQMDHLLKKLPLIVDETHIKHIETLSKDLTPTARIKKYMCLNWFLFVDSPGSFVLGDIGPITISTTSFKFNTLLFNNDDASEIYMPISDRHLLVGSLFAPDKLKPINSDFINKATASLSIEYFIATKQTEREFEYSNLIGNNTDLFKIFDTTPAEMEQAILEGLLGIS